VQPFLEESVMCSIEFVFVELELPKEEAKDSASASVNLPLELFGVFIQEFYQCSLLRIANGIHEQHFPA